MALDIVRIQQPTNTTCGQTSVAMITGASVNDVCNVMKTSGKTNTKHLVSALRHYGFDCHDRLIRVNANTTLPELAIVKLYDPDDKSHLSHWVVYYEGRYFDPSSAVCIVKYGWRPTSYLAISAVRP